MSGRVSLVLLLRAAWAGLAFLSSLLVARLYGAEGAGTYFLAVAVTTVCTTIAQMGTDLPVMRTIAVAHERRDWPTVRGLLRSALFICLIMAGILTGAVIAAAGLAGDVFADASLPVMLRVMALGIAPYTFVLIQSRAFMALGKPGLAEFTHRLGFQIVFIALIVALASRLDRLALGIAFAASYWLLFLLGRWHWKRAVPADTAVRSTGWDILLRPGLPILLTSSIHLVVEWSDTLLIGYFLSPESVGIYGVALRVSTIMAIILGAATSVFGPRFAALYQDGALDELGRIVRKITAGCALLALPLLALFLALPGPLMSLFGEEFRVGATAFQVLAIGQFAHVASGLVGLLLAMTGHERYLLYATAVAAILNVVLNLILIPPHGILGAAAATAVSLIVTNAVNVYLVRRTLGIHVFGIGRSALQR